MTCILLNMISLGMSYESMSKNYEYGLTVGNLLFTIVFIIECILKLTGYGIKSYFYKGWNQFDCFVVITSILDLIIEAQAASSSSTGQS